MSSLPFNFLTPLGLGFSESFRISSRILALCLLGIFPASLPADGLMNRAYFMAVIVIHMHYSVKGLVLY